MVIFSRHVLKPNNAQEKQELAVTLLHELTHLMFTDQDQASQSYDEAVHDLRCYKALDVQIPADRWAFKRFNIDVDKL